MKRLFLAIGVVLLGSIFAVIINAATIYQTIPTPKITYSDYVGIRVTTDETLVDTTILDSGLTRQVEVPGKSTVAVQIQGTWTGTLLFEGSNTDTPTASPTFVSLYAVEPNDGTIATSTTDNGLFVISVGGLKTFRVRSETSAWTGKATIKIQTSLGAYKPTTQPISGTITSTPSGTQAVSNQALTNAQADTGTYIKPTSTATFPVSHQALTDARADTGLYVKPTTAASWSIRALTAATDTVHVDSPILATVSGTATVSATDLDIRDLTAATDTVHIDSPILATVSGTVAVSAMTDVTLTPTFYEITLTDTATVDSTINLPAKTVAFEFWTDVVTHTIEWNLTTTTPGTYVIKNPGVRYFTFGLGSEKLYTGRFYFKDTTEAGCVVNVIVWTKP